jgi:uncharacterized repeat protein (TIGR01451 family)
MAKRRITWDTKYALSIIGFIGGIVLIALPFSPEGLIELPITGEPSALTISVQTNKTDVQRDDPTIDAQVVNYTVDIENTAECLSNPLDIVLVFDASGSMLDLMASAKQAGLTFLDNIDFTQHQVGVVSYNDSVFLEQPLSTDKQSIINSIEGLTSGGFTNIGDGLAIAHQELESVRHNPEAAKILVIFTDGRANRPEDKDPQAYAQSISDQIKQEQTRIISVAFGRHADTSLMQVIASPGIGNYYFAPSGNDMVQAYAMISESIQNHSAGTVVKIDLTEYMDIIDVLEISGNGVYENGYVTWEIGTLQCQESQDLSFRIEVNNQAVDLTVLDVAGIISNRNGEQVSSSPVLTTIHAPAFNITKSDFKDEALPQESLDYEITIENVGTGNAYQVVFTDILPQQYFSPAPRSISPEGQYSDPDKTIFWDNQGEGFTLNGSFEPTSSQWGSNIVLEFTGNIDQDLDYGDYTLTNICSLETASGYTQEARDETRVPYGADLVIRKTSDPVAYASWGQEVIFYVEVENQGWITAENVRIEDNFNELRFNPREIQEGQIDEGVIVWELDDLGSGQRRIFEYRASLIDTPDVSTEVITSEARVSSDTFEINYDNNQVTHELTATSDPLLSVSLESDKSTYTQDEQIKVDVVILNNGNIDAHDVQVAITIPVEFGYLDGSSFLNGQSINDPTISNQLIWSIPGIAGQDQVELTFSLSPNSNCLPANYEYQVELQWSNDLGDQFGPANDQIIIGITESIQAPTGEFGAVQTTILPPEQPNLIQGVTSLVVTGEGFVYLKILLGLAIALPLPLLLIFDKRKKETERKKTPKKTKKSKKK